MNIILLNKEDASDTHFTIKDKNIFEHVTKVLKSEIGDTLKLGIINGMLGRGEIAGLDRDKKEITLTRMIFDTPAPKAMNVILVIAMPRPKTLKKALHVAISMGVKKIYIIKTWRVDKSYWSSEVLREDSIKSIAVEALQQAKDTIMPEIEIRKRFKPFIEDELEFLSVNKRGVVAHPISEKSFLDPDFDSDIDILVIGPEGGFIEYEINKFKEIGFEILKLNERILRVEYATAVILSRLMK